MTTAGRTSAIGRRLAGLLRRDRSILLNAGSLVGATVITSGLGAAFWLLAAREFSQQAVGVASAAVAAMMILGFIATVGLGTLLMGELAGLRERRRGVISAALVVSGALGAAIGAGFALLAPVAAPDLDPLRASWLAIAVFSAGVALTALTYVLDQALIGLMRGGLQLWRNVVFSAVKLAALAAVALAVASSGSVLIYSTWVIGLAISIPALPAIYRRRSEDSIRPSFAPLLRMRAAAATHHAVNVALRVPELVMPVAVVITLSATANANFYVSWMIAGLLFVIPISLSTVLYAAAASDDVELGSRLRLSLLGSLAFGALANLAMIGLASPLLGLFGSDYEDATTLLQLLALGVFPEAVRTHYVALSRIERRLGAALPVIWGGAALEVVGGTLGAVLGGLEGVAIGWLAGICIEAAVMGPAVLGAIRADAGARGGRRPAREALAAADPGGGQAVGAE